MHLTVPIFLAEKNESNPYVFLIFVAIWVLFSIISAIAKKQEEAKRKRVREQLERGAQAPSAPEMFQSRMQRPEPAVHTPARQPPAQQRIPVERQRPPREKKRIAQRQAPRQAPPPIPAVPVHEVIPQATQIPHDVFAEKRVPRAQPNVGADALNRWLRPETLRQQFILTEILQPPLALRPERE